MQQVYIFSTITYLTYSPSKKKSMWLLFCFNRFFHNQVSNGPFTFSTPRPPFVHDAFWIWLKQVILILYLSLSPNIYIFFVKPVFFWYILSIFSLGVPCFHQHGGPTQASGSSWLRGCVERSMCDSFGRGTTLTGGGLKNSEVKEAQKTKQIEGVMMWKKNRNIMYRFDLWEHVPMCIQAMSISKSV